MVFMIQNFFSFFRFYFECIFLFFFSHIHVEQSAAALLTLEINKLQFKSSLYTRLLLQASSHEAVCYLKFQSFTHEWKIYTRGNVNMCDDDRVLIFVLFVFITWSICPVWEKEREFGELLSHAAYLGTIPTH